MAKILVIAKGSFGDTLPVIGLANNLRTHGHDVKVACRPDLLAHLEDQGLRGIPLTPDGVVSQSGKNRHRISDLATRVLSFGFNERLDNEIETLSPIAAESDLILGNQLAFSTSLLAEIFDKKWVYCGISPISIISRDDPPVLPVLRKFRAFRKDPRSQRGLEILLARWASRFAVNEVLRQRRRHNLADKGHPLFEGKLSPYLNLILCSPLFVQPQKDWPERTYVTGFSWFEPTWFLSDDRLGDVQRFLSGGSPPVIVCLGSESRARPGSFYDVSLQACRRLGLRIVLIAKKKVLAGLPRGDDVLPIGYFPYSMLFPDSLLVIHSGGIGTIGWCLRSAKHSILSPGGGMAIDQFDNAYRASRLGCATIVERKQFSVDSVEKAIASYLRDSNSQAQLDLLSEQITAEDGAEVGRALIEDLLSDRSPHK